MGRSAVNRPWSYAGSPWTIGQVSVPTGRLAGTVAALPPSSFFLTSAVFHYLGPSLAVLLFAHVGVLGVAWLRIGSAAVVFALWRRPWRVLRRATPDQRLVLVAAAVATPIGAHQATAAFGHPLWLAWGVGVGVCSSVIPYVTDQLAMARLPRATFALMLALLPATATVIGLLVLAQVPTGRDLLGIALVIAGLAAHRGARPAGVPPVTRGRAPDAAGTAPRAARPRPGAA